MFAVGFNEVWSTYKSGTTPHGRVIGRGINNLIVLFEGKRDAILAETWSRETKDNPLPARLATARQARAVPFHCLVDQPTDRGEPSPRARDDYAAADARRRRRPA